MLLAELHGKRCPDVEGSEDMLTSAVFGHLRLVPPDLFWVPLLQRARLAGSTQHLLAWLQGNGVDLALYQRLQYEFLAHVPGLW